MWKSAKRDEFIPLDAPVAGYEIWCSGIKGPSPLFIIRAKVNGGIHPGKWVFGNTAWVPWGGREHFCNEFEVYVGALKMGRR
ncbi:DUF3421 domain-containing protein [Escherichia coli]|nr:DUF3421 domain-containing protein [Escherichia coli]